MIGIFLLVGKDISDVKVAAPGDVHSFVFPIEIDPVHALNGWEICDLFAGLRIHDNHPRGHACPDKQPVRFFIKRSVTIALAADRPCGHHFAFLRIHNLNLACGGHEDEQGLSGLVQQKFRRVRLHSDVVNMLIRLGVDNPNFPVILTCILATVSYIEKFAVGIVRDTVGS